MSMSLRMTSPTVDPTSPVVQAEQARQVVGVLSWIERRFAAGGWTRGARFAGDGRICLIGGIDEASEWTMEGVAEEATRQLALRLPAPLRAVGRVRPRLALSVYNDVVGGRRGATDLVRRTRHDLGGVSPISAGVPPLSERTTVTTRADQTRTHAPTPVR